MNDQHLPDCGTQTGGLCDCTDLSLPSDNLRHTPYSPAFGSFGSALRNLGRAGWTADPPGGIEVGGLDQHTESWIEPAELDTTDEIARESAYAGLAALLWCLAFAVLIISIPVAIAAWRWAI
jgi:hypothetical protein